MKIKIIRQIPKLSENDGVTMGRVFSVVEDEDGLTYRPGKQTERAWIMGDAGEEVMVMGFEFEILDEPQN